MFWKEYSSKILADKYNLQVFFCDCENIQQRYLNELQE